MSVERQQGRDYQLDLFDEALLKALRHGASGDGGTGTGAREEPQALTASAQQRALTQDLMERVASSANLNHAYKRVKANKGAPGAPRFFSLSSRNKHSSGCNLNFLQSA